MPSQCPPESFCAETGNKLQGLDTWGFKRGPSGRQLSGQEASDGSHEVMWAVGVDPVPGIRHDLYLGPREESLNLRVVTGTVSRGEGRQQGVKVGRWEEKEKRRHIRKRWRAIRPVVFPSSRELTAPTQTLPTAGSPGK